jgi:anthranilate phosphoribosyltransferase
VGGGLSELAPAPAGEAVVPHFLDRLSGGGGPVATRTIALNAAALVVASGATTSWSTATRAAIEAIESGAAVELVGRLQAQGTTSPPRGAIARG